MRAPVLHEHYHWLQQELWKNGVPYSAARVEILILKDRSYEGHEVMVSILGNDVDFSLNFKLINLKPIAGRYAVWAILRLFRPALVKVTRNDEPGSPRDL